MKTPKTLRGALQQIERMLDKQPYSADLWDILSAVRGPDSRKWGIKDATTTIIRSEAFPKHPCEERSFYGWDNKRKVTVRKRLFKNKEDSYHFRMHVEEAFNALGLKLFEEN